MMIYNFYKNLQLFFLCFFLYQPIIADPVSKSLKSSPWYDYKAKDYHKYTKKDITIPKQKKESPARLPSPRLGWFLKNIVTLVLLTLASIAICLILYYSYKYFKEKKPEIKQNRNTGSIEYSNIPDSIHKTVDLQKAITLSDLKKIITECIASNKMEMASIYIYLFVLIKLQKTNILIIKKQSTAREYLKIYQTSKNKNLLFSLEIIKQTVHLFEHAMYNGHIKSPSAISRLWEDICQSMDVKK